MAFVMITTLHESERTAVLSSSLKVERHGEGMIVGEADEPTIDALRSFGLSIDLAPAKEALVEAGFEPKSELQTFTGALPLAPVRVVLACRGPIDPAWVTELETFGGTDISRFIGDQLAVQVETDAELAAIATRPWVLGVRALSRERLVGAGAATCPLIGDPLPPEDADPAWDIEVSGAVTVQDVVTWALGKGLALVGHGRRRVRVRVPVGQESVLEETRMDYAPFAPPGLHNDLARAGIGMANGARAFVAGVEIELTGEGELVGIADSGFDETHPDFAGRIAAIIARGRPGDSSDRHGHGTHVAGTVLGDGASSDGAFAGIAPRARLVFQAIQDASGHLGGLPIELRELFQEAWEAGARIHNNSWGQPVQSRYTGTSEDVDEFMWENPEMLIVISAGNHGSNAPDPALTQPRPGGRVQPISLGAPATSKNALVVGACRSTRKSGGLSDQLYAAVFNTRFQQVGGATDVGSQTISGDPEQLAAFSSRGPCVPSRRIKPDLVAPGTDIVSARSAIAPSSNFWALHENAHYGYMGGTSMAAPVVAGIAALVREYYRRHRGVSAPSAALLKATLINGTRQLSGSDAGDGDAAVDGELAWVPNSNQGFGAINLSTTLPGATTRLAFRDVSNANGLTEPMSRHRYTVRTNTTGPLRVCLAFTDPPGTSLVNDLDLWVEPPGIGAAKLLGNPNLRGKLLLADVENNVEIVRVASAPPGTWTISVVCRNLLEGPQGYALVVLGNLDTDDLDAG